MLDNILNSKFKNILILVLLAIICFIVYGNTLTYNFVLDDYSLVLNNPLIKNLKFLPAVFSSDLYHSADINQTGYYRPLLLVSYSLDYALWKLKPFGFHLTNILTHILNSFLIFLLIKSIFNNFRLALGTSIIFCIHPIHISAVGYISGRADLLCASFILLGLYCLKRYFMTNRLYHYGMTLIFATAAFLTRENSLIFPFLAFLLAIYMRLSWKKILLPCAGIIIIAYFYLLNRHTISSPLALGTSSPISPLPLHLELLNIINILKEYAILIIFPISLYPMRTIPIITTLTVQAAIFFLILILLIMIIIKNKSRLAGFGLLWSAISFLPLLIMIYIFPTMGLTMAEHWLYLPSVGIIIILIFYSQILKQKQSLWLALLAIFFGLTTIMASPVWKNDLTLSRHILKFSENNAIAHLNLAGAYYKLGQYDYVIHTLANLSSPEPNLNCKIQDLLGLSYEAKGDFARALSHYKKATQIQPSFYVSNFNLGRMYLHLNDIPNTLRYFSKALENNPSSYAVYSGLGTLYKRLQNPQLALLYFKKGLELNPGNNYLTLEIANYFEEINMQEEARKFLSNILIDDNTTLQEIKNTAAIYGNMNDFLKAISLWQEALRRNPNDIECMENILKAQNLQKTL